jgi:hypothetical protein
MVKPGKKQGVIIVGQRPGTNPNVWIKKCNSPLRNRPGEFCQKPKLKDKERCQIHGGNSLKGIEAPSFKEGRYVEALGGHSLGKRLEAAHNDTTLMELIGEVALVQAIIEDLCSRFAEGGQAEGMGTVKEVKKIYKDMVAAGVKKDWNMFNHLLETLGDALDTAEHQFALIEEVKSAVRTKKDLVDSQTKREFQLQQMIKASEVQVYITQLLAANRNIIYDRLEDKKLAESILQEIAGEFSQLIGEGDSVGSYSALPEG